MDDRSSKSDHFGNRTGGRNAGGRQSPSVPCATPSTKKSLARHLWIFPRNTKEILTRSAKLAANITKGGAFGWKITNMPPRGMGANDAEIKAMAEYIAGLAK